LTLKYNQVNKGGYATILAYKDTGRHETLDDNIQYRMAKEIRPNRQSFVLLGWYLSDKLNQWIWKQDYANSNTEKEKKAS
jgi:hypothetical protein